MGTWHNADGLFLTFGTDKATANTAGEYRSLGKLREVEVKIDLTALTEAEVVQSDTTFIPAGARIEEVEIVTHTAAATGTAIDVGLVRTDRTTAIDADGLIQAEVTADMSTTGEKNVFRQEAGVGASLGGALIGTTLANVGLITASRTTATAFTAGLVHVCVRYYMP
jgi:hypothetical protein